MKNNRGLTFIEILIVLTLIVNLNSVFGATIQVVELPEIIDEGRQYLHRQQRAPLTAIHLQSLKQTEIPYEIETQGIGRIEDFI